MRDHRKLRAFELADELALLTYRITKDFPKEEVYGLTSQMRRSAVSVPSNIVEGSSRDSNPDYIRFLEISYGSLKELHYQFSLATRLGYLSETPNEVLLNETGKVLSSLIRSLRRQKFLTPKYLNT